MRIVFRSEKGPVKVGEKWICMCGLSRNRPFCDGSHTLARDEDDGLYIYRDGKRKRVEIREVE